MNKIFRCTTEGSANHVPLSDSALIYDVNGSIRPEGYSLYLAKTIGEGDGNTCLLPDGCEEGSFVCFCDEDGAPKITLLETCDRPDHVLFLTGKCNSNCIMCPYTEHFRLNASHEELSALLRFIELMDPYAEYLCLTGGEPTLLKEDFLTVLQAARAHFNNAMVHILTNGRTFAYPDFLKAFQSVRPYKTLLGIPLHGSTAELHDYITQAPGSFEETIAGLDALYAAGEHIEIRIVTSGLNAKDLPALARMIVRRYPYAYHVCLMGLEMMGNAMTHRKDVWLAYDAIWPYVREAADILVSGGVQTELYNYPLCAVDKRLQALYRRSITPSKVEYLPACDLCRRKDECGGFFRTTKIMPDIMVKPY